MKSRILIIIGLLLGLLLVISMIAGIKLGSLEIPSVSELIEKNENINSNIQEVGQLALVTYPDTVQQMESTYDKLILKKQKYEEISLLSETDDNKIYETKKYDIGYLWKIIGKYIVSRNLAIAMDVKNSGQSDLYNLQFTVTGQYVNISQFISDIENNSDLCFRIYNFKMTGSGETVNATFTVKDINIDASTIKKSSNTQK